MRAGRPRSQYSWFLSRRFRSGLLFSGAAVEFIFEQAAFDAGVVEGDFSAGSQADFFAELEGKSYTVEAGDIISFRFNV